jgi:hypothetical protein
MLTSKLTNCKEGGNIQDLLNRINCKLSELSYDMYNNITFMLNINVPSSEITQLLMYRNILIDKQVNLQMSTEDYSLEDISGKVIRLTAGCNPKCSNKSITFTTTSTTTNPI